MRTQPSSRTYREKLHKQGFTTLETLVGLIVILILVAVIAPTTAYYISKADSRAMLAQAKAAKMAVHTVALEHYASNTPIQDQSQPYGFAKGVEEEIKELAQFQGELYLQQYDPVSKSVLGFVYVEGAYCVEYAEENNQVTWNVYKSKHLIQY